jgi:hypothetical protein
MPVYTSCFLHPVWGYVDHPWYYGPTIDCRQEGSTYLCQTGGACCTHWSSLQGMHAQLGLQACFGRTHAQTGLRGP